MNEVNLIGNFTKEFVYSHTTNNIDFYSSVISVNRFSSAVDDIMVISPTKLEDLNCRYYIHGELRVFNRHGHSKYYVYPDFMYQVDEPYQNQIELIGRVGTISERRQTPKSCHIRDVMLLMDDDKPYSIPLIFWNSLAKKNLYQGEELHIKGRLQSRIYVKNDISRKIIEVSVNEII